MLHYFLNKFNLIIRINLQLQNLLLKQLVVVLALSFSQQTGELRGSC